jgi:ParB family transcriptional regulator, chromosome partitioning protein
MQIENLRIADLTPDPQNARQHDDKNLKAIQGSLTQFGQRKPIVITEAGVIVAGNGTVEAAKLLGWTNIMAVKVPEDWTPAQVKAFAIADNRTAELATWKTEVLSAQLVELQNLDVEIEAFGFEQEQSSMDDFADALDGLLKPKGDIEQITFTLHTDQAQLIKEALDVSKGMGDFGDTGNTNSNGNAITRIVELWMGSNVG